MIEHCGGRIHMCAEFTSLTSKEMDVFYQAVDFQTQKYANDFQLRVPVIFKSRENHNEYHTIQQIKEADNGSSIIVQV